MLAWPADVLLRCRWRAGAPSAVPRGTGRSALRSSRRQLPGPRTRRAYNSGDGIDTHQISQETFVNHENP